MSKGLKIITGTAFVAIILALVSFVMPGQVAAADAARPYEGYGDFGQPPIVEYFYLNESGSLGITNDMWGADISNIRMNYRFLSMANFDKAMYSVWRTQGVCDISNPSMSGGCIPGTMMKNLSEDVILDDGGVEFDASNRSFYVSPGKPYTDGTYVILMSAITQEGYMNSGAATWFGIDKTYPEQLTLVSPDNGSDLENTEVTLSWETPDDDIIEYELSLDGSIQDLTEKNKSVDLDTGDHTWKVRAIDKVGNVGPWSEEYSFAINTPEEPYPTIDDDPEDTSDKSDTQESAEDADETSGTVGGVQTVAAVDAGSAAAATEDNESSDTRYAIAGDEEVSPTEEGSEDGEVLGAETEDAETDQNNKDNEAEVGEWDLWWLWLILAVIAGVIIWLLWKRHRDNEEDSK